MKRLGSGTSKILENRSHLFLTFQMAFSLKFMKEILLDWISLSTYMNTVDPDFSFDKLYSRLSELIEKYQDSFGTIKYLMGSLDIYKQNHPTKECIIIQCQYMIENFKESPREEEFVNELKELCIKIWNYYHVGINKHTNNSATDSSS